MRRSKACTGLAAVAAGMLAACGGGSGGGSPVGGGPTPTLDSYLGTTGVFVAWADESSGTYNVASIGSFAGKRQVLRGTIDFITGKSLGQAAGLEIYKGSGGNIYALDLTSTTAPAPQQVSTESAATLDDTCSLSGTSVAGANYDYVGVYFTADLVTPTNSSYFYRLPGPSGVCNTPDDIVHMVKTGMSATSAPIVATGMPIATVRTSMGGISGFVVKSGASLALVDGNFANPTILGTFAQTVGVAVALPAGTTAGYPTGELYVVDGNIVYIDYVGKTISAPLFTIPNWSPTNAGALFAASPTTLYFSINTPASGATPESASIYSMPANGTAAPTVVATESGRVATLVFPVAGNDLLWGVLAPTYAIRALPVAGGSPITLAATSGNYGTFIATAAAVYYEFAQDSYSAATTTLTRSGTSSGIVGVDGTVIQLPLAGSTFVSGGEAMPWPNDTTTTATPFETVFQIQGLTPVTVKNATTGETYVEDGVSGGTLIAIDTTSNLPGATIGQLPVSSATSMTDTFRDGGHTGFLEAYTPISTDDPATRDLYILNSQSAGSLTLTTNNL